MDASARGCAADSSEMDILLKVVTQMEINAAAQCRHLA